MCRCRRSRRSEGWADGRTRWMKKCRRRLGFGGEANIVRSEAMKLAGHQRLPASATDRRSSSAGPFSRAAPAPPQTAAHRPLEPCTFSLSSDCQRPPPCTFSRGQVIWEKLGSAVVDSGLGAVSPGAGRWQGYQDARRGAMGGARSGPAASSRSGDLAIEPPEVRQLAQLALSLLRLRASRRLGSARWRAAAVVRSIPSKLTDAAQNRSGQGATRTSPSPPA